MKYYKQGEKKIAKNVKKLEISTIKRADFFIHETHIKKKKYIIYKRRKKTIIIKKG